MTPAPLKIERLSAGYGRLRVFSDISLSLEPGAIFGLIGLNGVGKTTLIKAVLGLGEAEGAISLFGMPAPAPESRARLAYLPEKFQPSPMLKGWELLSLTLAYYNLPLDRARALDLAEGLGFDAKALARPARTYSKGMGQKLGLIATLLTAQPLLILDEPMSGLDPRSRILLKDRLLDYRRAGNTIFFSSHILADIEEICDRIAILHGGRLIYEGTPGQLIAERGTPGLERAFLAEISAAEEGLAAETPRRQG